MLDSKLDLIFASTTCRTAVESWTKSCVHSKKSPKHLYNRHKICRSRHVASTENFKFKNQKQFLKSNFGTKKKTNENPFKKTFKGQYKKEKLSFLIEEVTANPPGHFPNSHPSSCEIVRYISKALTTPTASRPCLNFPALCPDSSKSSVFVFSKCFWSSAVKMSRIFVRFIEYVILKLIWKTEQDHKVNESYLKVRSHLISNFKAL